MAHKPPPRPAAPEAPAKAKKKSPVPISTIVTLAVALPIGYWAFNSFRKWTRVKSGIANVEQDLNKLRQRNGELAIVYDNVQLKKFEACNKGADQVTINWVAAAYYNVDDPQRTIKIFNSDQCQDFKPIVLAAGDNKAVLLRSSQPGCNWSGDVFYYAVRYTQENEESEKYQVNNTVGPYQGFDRDCYTFR
jgi:hypothetical protein